MKWETFVPLGIWGIEISAYGENWIEAKMPIDHRTTQPFGLLHGGVSCLLWLKLLVH